MGKEIDNHVAKLDLDSSGFLKGAEEVLKAIGKLETALEFKGAEKGVETFIKSAASIMGEFPSAIEKPFAKAIQSIGNDLNEIGGAAQKAANTVVSAFDDIFSGVSKSSSAAVGAFSESFAEISSAAADLSDAFSTAFSDINASLASMSGSVSKKFGDQIQDLASEMAVAASGLEQLAVSAGNAHAYLESSFSGIAYSSNEAADNLTMLETSAINSFDRISESAQASADQVAKAFNTLPDSVGATQEAIKGIGNEISAAVQDTEEKAKGSFDKIKIYAAIAATAVGSAAVFAFQHWNDDIAKAVEGIGETLKSIGSGIASGFSSIIGSITKKINIVKAAFDGVRRALETAFPNTMSAIGDQVEKELDRMQEKARTVANGIRAMLGLSTIEATGAAEATKKVGEAAEESAGKIVDGAEKGAASTSKLAGSAKDAADATAKVGGSASASFNEAAGSADKAASATASVGQSAKNVFSAMKTLAEGTVGSTIAMKSLGEAAVKLAGGDLSGAAKAVGNLAKAMAETTKSGDFEKTAKSVKAFGEALTTAMGGADKAKSTFAPVREIVSALSKDFADLPKNLDNVSAKSGIVGSVLKQVMDAATGSTKDFLKALAGIPGAQSALGSGLALALSNMRKHMKESLHEGEEQTGVTKKAVEALGSSAEVVGGKFSAMGAVAFGALERIGQKAVDAGTRLLKSLSVDNISQGWEEYGLKINSTQTIMASTGESLSTVNGYLEELNKYADRTIYSFSDMTQNIGKFTNAGVDLDTAVAAIKGISNEAAISGANANEASRAMYNFAQALSAGYVKLIDWKSIENANMATKGFKEQLIQTALELKTLKETEEGYISTTTDANGHVSEAFTATKFFNESLSAQWMTTEVLTKTLAKYADETTEFGQKAYAAAQDIKTGAQLMDTLKEAVGSGWSKTFELIIGNLDEAKQFWTGISNLISPILNGIADARNGLLEGWKALGGRDDLISGLKRGFEGLVDILKSAKEGFETFFPPLTAERLADFTGKIGDLVSKIAFSEKDLRTVKDIFGEIGKSASAVKDGFKTVIDKIAELAGKSSLLNDLKDVVNKIFGTDIFTRSGFLDGVLTLTTRITQFVSGGVVGKIVGLFDTLETYMGGGSKLNTNLRGIGDLLSNLINLAIGTLEHLWNIGKTLGEALAPVWETLKANFPVIYELLNGVVDVVRGVVEVTATLIEKYLADWLKYLPGIAEILVGAATVAIKAISAIASAIGDFLTKHADGLASLIKTVLAVISTFKALKAIGGVLLTVGTTVLRFVKCVQFLKGVGTVIKTVAGYFTGFKDVVNIISGLTGKIAGLFLTLGKIGIVIAAIAAVTAAIVAVVDAHKKHEQAIRDEIEQLYGLTDGQKKFLDRLNETAEAYDRAAEARKKTYSNVDSEFNYYQQLANELDTLIDENGKIKDGAENRASVIMGILSEALDIEFEKTGNVVSNYKEANAQITDLIKNKKALAYIDATSEDYNQAVKDKDYNELEFGKAGLNLHSAEKERDLLYGIKDDLADHVGAAAVELSAFNGNTQKWLKENGYVDSDGYAVGLPTAWHRLNMEGGIIQTAENNVATFQEGYDKAEKIMLDGLNLIQNTDRVREAVEAGDTKGLEQASIKLSAGFVNAENATRDVLTDQATTLQKTYSDILDAYNQGAKGITKEMVGNAKYLADEAAKELNRYGTLGADERNAKHPEVKDTYKKPAPTEDQKEKSAAAADASKNFKQGEDDGSAYPKGFADGYEKETQKGQKKIDAIESAIEKTSAAKRDKKMQDAAAKASKHSVEAAEKAMLPAVKKLGDKAEKAYSESSTRSANGIKSGEDANKRAAESVAGTVEQAFNSSDLYPSGKEKGFRHAQGVASTSGENAGAGKGIGEEINSGADSVDTTQTGVKKGTNLAFGVSSTEGANRSAAEGVSNAVSDGFSINDTYQIGYQKGWDYGLGLEEGMRAKLAAVAAMANTLAGMISATTSFALKENSPSKVAIGQSEYYGEGLVIGMENMEKAVRNESMTLSDTLVSGATAPLSSLSDILSGKFDDSMTITPVMDLSQIQNDAARLHEMLDGARVSVGRMDISGIMPDYAGADRGDDRTLNELKGLRKDMADFNAKLSNLQVRMDTGALVGTLASPMDDALGRRAAVKGRR